MIGRDRCALTTGDCKHPPKLWHVPSMLQTPQNLGPSTNSSNLDSFKYSIMSESEKYEVLEKIGLYFPMPVNERFTNIVGHGSFGVIHKVRRKSDGLVRHLVLVLPLSI